MLTDFSIENLTNLRDSRKYFLLQCPKKKVVRLVKFDFMDPDMYCIVSKQCGFKYMYVTKEGYAHTYTDGRTVITTIEDYSRILSSGDFSLEYYRNT